MTPHLITTKIDHKPNGDIVVTMPSDKADYTFVVRADRITSKATREHLARSVAAACILLRHSGNGWAIPDINDLLDAAQRLALSLEVAQITRPSTSETAGDIDFRLIQTYDANWLIQFEHHPHPK